MFICAPVPLMQVTCLWKKENRKRTWILGMFVQIYAVVCAVMQMLLIKEISMNYLRCNPCLICYVAPAEETGEFAVKASER